MKTRNATLLLTLCCVFLVGAAGVSPSLDDAATEAANRARPEDRDINLGLATTVPAFLDGRTAAIAVSEVHQHRDLNGDGDMIDAVMHVFDATTGTVRNLGLSVGSDPTGDPSAAFLFVFLEGRLFAFFASEDSGDLNGDGDVDDFVLHVYDTVRGSLLNLRLAEESPFLVFDGRHLAFLVSEALQGQRDLNRDGDVDDRVLHVFDVVTSRTRNTALAVLDFAVDMEFNPMELTTTPVPMSVSEQEQGGVDLNGDGDTLDRVLHVLDKGRVKNLRVAIADPSFFVAPQAGAGVVLAAVPEEVDVNGDQDVDDAVLQVVDISSGDIRNTGLVIQPFARLPIFDRERGLALVNVSEQAQGRDLNGDGNLDGHALQVVSTRTGQVRNLQFAAFSGFAAKGRALLLVSEGAGGSDLNGDGDIADEVAMFADLGSEVPRLVNTRLAIGKASDSTLFEPDAAQIRDGLVTLLVPEAAQGNRDLNADGDANDAVLHFFDLNTFVTRNSRLDGSLAYLSVLAPVLPLSEGRAVVPVLESKQGGKDLNRDGDTSDVVLQIFDTRSGSTRNTGLAVALETFFPFNVPLVIRGETFVAFLAQEGAVDLNGDGDTADRVHHILDVATGRITNLRRAALAAVPRNRSDLGFSFAGLTDSFGFEAEIFFGLRFLGRPSTDGPGFGDAFTFVVSEAAQGNVDLNGDGDSDDVVVHATRLTDRDRNGRFNFTEVK